MAKLLLTADSRPLVEPSVGLWPRVRPWLPERPKAVYLGASNADEPAFYTIFAAAMDLALIPDHRHVTARFAPAERSWLEAADLIVLSGGDTARGWRAFCVNGVDEVLVARVRAGAVLAGVSAGAVQIGAGFAAGDGEFVPTLGLLASVVDVHDEANGWQRLRATARQRGLPGLGVPFGAAVLVRPSGEREVLRGPVVDA